MSNEVFPASLPGITWQLTKTPRFSTRKQQAVSGYEVRVSKRALPMWDFKLSYEYLNGQRVAGVSELEQLVGLFLRHRGSWDSFLFTDFSDNNVTDQLIGVGDGTTKTFQLTRVWGSHAEPCTNINQIVNIKRNNVVVTNYTVSSMGLVTFITAPSAGQNVTWTGSYYYRARFSDDYIDADALWDDAWEAKKVELVATLGNRL